MRRERARTDLPAPVRGAMGIALQNSRLDCIRNPARKVRYRAPKKSREPTSDQLSSRDAFWSAGAILTRRHRVLEGAAELDGVEESSSLNSRSGVPGS